MYVWVTRYKEWYDQVGGVWAGVGVEVGTLPKEKKKSKEKKINSCVH